MTEQIKKRAPRNRTVTLTETERQFYRSRLMQLRGPTTLHEVIDRTICQDVFDILDWLPANSIDLLFADPPYNLTKSFHGHSFTPVSLLEYERWLESWLSKLVRVLKPTASVYICGDWRSSAAIHRVAEKHFIVRNRITWEREKGRGAKTNWKNCSEDIWFCTMSDEYVFNIEDVKLKRRVIAPYTDQEGEPKDWAETDEGRFRLTYPSNLWTDITVPFWSMPENTDHPTQKPEKLLAKIVLASSNPGDVVLDPFLGSGTTSVVAKKLQRHHIGIEIDEMYCCIAEKRLDVADGNPNIQGYSDGVFWERNTMTYQKGQVQPGPRSEVLQPTLFSTGQRNIR